MSVSDASRRVVEMMPDGSAKTISRLKGLVVPCPTKIAMSPDSDSER